MDPFEDLSGDSTEQIRKYLRFFRQKREGIVRDIDREMADIRSDRLDESMFSKEDMLEYADMVESAVRTQVNQDMGTIISMGALAVKELLLSAQEKGVELQLETSPLENQALLDAIDKMNLDAMPKTHRRGTVLPTFRDESKAMKEQSERLEDTNRRLMQEVDAASSKLRRLQQELDEAKEESARRVADTPQFQQMRRLMQTQSQKLRDLRRRLQQYEPDAVKEDDD